MNVLLVYAHPEPRSLNGALREYAVHRLEQAGHNVEVSDLYAMQWNPVLAPGDNLAWPAGVRFEASVSSRQALENGTQSADITREQEKLRWADAVIFQFPLWWFSMPAILKGWVERVYAYGFAYGVGEHSDTHWGDRYGEGTLAGKRAMLVVTTGGWAPHYAPRGINGPIDDILFPIQHGILFYPGFDVVPPHVIYRTSKVGEAEFEQACAALGKRLDDLWTTPSIPFRKQNAGAYVIPELTLRPELAAGESGFHIHLDQSW
ncbi:NAD(P)H-dependent oxidoreductase [Pseudomonas sp. RIT-PI-S]|uniref:NAD(P)H-dependent oxidoreductase n=1 Tax=Pseudomonas sp. RIT-PI-S TaxID=3035295 RepID=UPI0021DA6FB1|nr:NAD(P)H-dependent oxidoreductase [Pseudomonas sp. RIT-PI-S]